MVCWLFITHLHLDGNFGTFHFFRFFSNIKLQRNTHFSYLRLDCNVILSIKVSRYYSELRLEWLIDKLSIEALMVPKSYVIDSYSYLRNLSFKISIGSFLVLRKGRNKNVYNCWYESGLLSIVLFVYWFILISLSVGVRFGVYDKMIRD